MKATPRSYTLAAIHALPWLVIFLGLPLIVALLYGSLVEPAALDRAEYLRDVEPLEVETWDAK